MRVRWTLDGYDDLEGEPLVLPGELSGKTQQTSLAVERVEWTCALNVEAEVYFDSFPPGADGRIICAIPADSTSGEIKFTDWPSGALTDGIKKALPGAGTNPVNVSGGISVRTRGATQNDSLFLQVVFRERGVA
jgi:hypothetical protein